MDAAEFTDKVRRIDPARNVTLTFAKTGFAGLRRLRVLMGSNSNIKFANRGDIMLMLAVLATSNWGDDRNRTFVLSGLQSADDGWIQAIARDVDSVVAA